MQTLKYYLVFGAGLLLFSLSIYGQGLKNTVNTQLVVNGNAKIVLNNAGFTNNGTFIPGTGEVVFTGSGATSGSFIHGTALTGFYNLTLNKTSNGIQLNRNITVTHTLGFTSGDSIYLNGNNIDLESTGSLSGESGTKRITGRSGGYIQVTSTLNAPSGTNPGNLGFRITSAANLGSTIIRRGHQQQSGASIYRYFDVIPTNNTALNSMIQLNYFDQELAGLAEPNLGMFYSSNGGVNWSNLGEDGIDQGANFLTLNTVNILNRFTLANISMPLAVKLIRLYAVSAERKVILNWVTSAEAGNSYFDIERSADGIHYLKIGQTPGSGTTDQVQHYQFADPMPLPGKSYYRLREVDIDGKASYSYVVMMDYAIQTDQLMRLYPNPLSGTLLHLNIYSAKEGEQELKLFNQAGLLMRVIKVNCIAGTQVIEFNTGLLPAGIYTIRLQNVLNKGLTFIKQ